jgi:tetratricopeptide (TPR) repeat protein
MQPANAPNTWRRSAATARRKGSCALRWNAQLLTILGYLLRMQGCHLDALAACDAAVSSAPDWGDAHVQRVWILIDIHRGAEAIAAASEAVRLGPHLAERHLALAQALSQDDRVDEARETAREALRLAPRSASALLTHDRPAEPDLFLLVWPIRRVVVAPRWWLPGAAMVVAAGGLVTATLDDPAAGGAAVRGVAALTCTVTIGFVLRLLGPAGRLPWQALRLSPPLVRRSLGAGLAVMAVALGLLGGYAAGGPLALPILAVAAGPVLWICMVGERLGHGLDDAGDRQFLLDWRVEVRDVLRELRQWPAQTRRELRAAWHETDTDEREQKRRRTALRQPLAVYRSRLRNNVLCAAFGLVTLVATIPVVASWPSTGATVWLTLFVLLTLYVSVRMAVMKAIATPEGLILNGPLWTVIVRWQRVATVVADDTAHNGGLIPVRAPVLVLTDGRRFKVRQASVYDLSARHVRHHPNAWVNHVAAELEVIRLT